MLKYLAPVLFIFLTVAVSGCTKNNESKTLSVSGNNSTATGMQEDKSKAPDFTLAGIDGKNISLSDYKGKVVIIDFWATWCPPCRRGIPDLIDLQKQYKDQISVIGISLDQENTKAGVPDFVTRMGINYPIVYYNDKVINDYGGVSAIPTTFIIDKNGNIINKMVGLYPKSEIEKQLLELLKGS